MAKDPYQELGVSRTAGADEIRKAFRKLAKQNHPDGFTGRCFPMTAADIEALYHIADR